MWTPNPSESSHLFGRAPPGAHFLSGHINYIKYGLKIVRIPEVHFPAEFEAYYLAVFIQCVDLYAILHEGILPEVYVDRC